MKPKVLLSCFGLLMQALTFAVHFCAALPHTRSHRHNEHDHQHARSLASSGSSVVLESVGTTCGTLETGSKIGYAILSLCVGLGNRSAPLFLLATSSLGTARLLTDLTNTPSPTTRITPFPLERKNSGERRAVPTSLAGSSSIGAESGIRTSLGNGAGVYSYPTLDVSIPSSASNSKFRRENQGWHKAKHHHYQTLELADIPEPMSSSTTLSATLAPLSTICPAGNGTTYMSKESVQYQVICDIDFPGNDFPFLLVDSLDSCVQACDAFNVKASSNKCLAALFLPSRLFYLDDCYLKHSVDHPTVATGGIEGVILATFKTSTSTSVPPTAVTKLASPVKSLGVSSVFTTQTLSKLSSLPTSEFTQSITSPRVTSNPVVMNSGFGVSFASGNTVVIPKVASSQLHGSLQNVPSSQYIDMKSPPLLDLSESLLVVGLNGDLTTGYDISLGTGILQVNKSTQPLLSPLKNTPHLSRDGGRGGYLNGQHLFLFCDTGSYTTTTPDDNGDFLGFVSSSVAIDTGMNGLEGKPLNIQDGIGVWSDDAGRMRSFAPLTEGEQSYNQVMQGKGQRYAIWPEASIIPLDAETAIIYAPIVYDDVNMDTKAAVFSYTGTTLLSITIPGNGGPVAQRVAKKIFEEDEIEWGCSGGIRSWGPSGIGGTDGKVYVFGNVQGGLLLARTSSQEITDHDSVGSPASSGLDLTAC